MSIVATGRVLPAPSRAERKVTSASKGHCIGFAVLGRGAGVRMQAESHLELNHLYLLNADPAIADLREQVRFRYSAKQIDALENGMFDGFRVTATSPKLHASSDGHGRSIVPVAPEEADPTDRPKGVGRADTPHDVVPVAPLPARRQDDETWAFDE